MITPQLLPDQVNLLNESVIVKLYGSGKVTNSGANAYAYISPTSGQSQSAGSTLTFKWNGKIEVISFVEIPDDSGNQCPKLTLSNNTVWVSQYLKPALMANYELSNDFNFIVQGNTLKLTAKKTANIGLTVTQVGTGYTSSAYAGANISVRSGYGYLLQTWIRNESGIEVMVNEDRLIPDSSGIATCDVAELLRPYVTPEVDGDQYAQLIQARRKMSVSFFFKYAEYWSGDTRRINQTQDFIGVWGGLSNEARKVLSSMDTTWWSNMKIGRFYLTNQPISKVTFPKSREKLFLIWPDSGSTSMVVKAQVTTNAGVVSTVTMGTLPNPVQYMIYEINTNIAKLSSFPLGSVKKYKVWVENQTGKQIGAEQSYVLNYRKYRTERMFLFRNSLGGFDCITAHGRLSKTGEISRQITEYNYQNSREAWNNQCVINADMVIGAVSRQYRAYLQDLLLSTKVYLVGTKALYDIIITSNKSELDNDDPGRQVAGFSFTMASRNQFYTPIQEQGSLIIGPPNPDQNPNAYPNNQN